MTVLPTTARPTEIAVRKATTSAADDLVEVLARAFDDDPVINWFVRQDTGRHDAFRRFFDLAVRTMTLPRTSGSRPRTSDRTRPPQGPA